MGMVNKTFIVFEILKDGLYNHAKYYKFKLPQVGEKDFYRMTSSYNWFFHGPKRRNELPDRLFTVAHEDERAPEFFIKGVELVDVGSLWDFYKAVGYDYKKQKWKNATP